MLLYNFTLNYYCESYLSKPQVIITKVLVIICESVNYDAEFIFTELKPFITIYYVTYAFI